MRTRPLSKETKKGIPLFDGSRSMSIRAILLLADVTEFPNSGDLSTPRTLTCAVLSYTAHMIAPIRYRRYTLKKGRRSSDIKRMGRFFSVISYDFIVHRSYRMAT